MTWDRAHFYKYSVCKDILIILIQILLSLALGLDKQGSVIYARQQRS